MQVDRLARLIRHSAVGTGVFVGLAATAVYLRHRDVPGAKELWELGLLAGAEIALVTAGLTFIAQCVAQRANDATTKSEATQHPSPRIFPR